MELTDYGNSNIKVSQTIKNSLPSVLIDYLIGLVSADHEISGNQHVFKLDISQLSGRKLQDINHSGANDKSVIHRVFGYMPVNAEIIMVRDITGLQMTMASEGYDVT